MQVQQCHYKVQNAFKASEFNCLFKASSAVLFDGKEFFVRFCKS